MLWYYQHEPWAELTLPTMLSRSCRQVGYEPRLLVVGMAAPGNSSERDSVEGHSSLWFACDKICQPHDLFCTEGPSHCRMEEMWPQGACQPPAWPPSLQWRCQV